MRLNGKRSRLGRFSKGVHVDSTPVKEEIDAAHNDGKLWASDNEERRDEWMEWVDLHMSKATIPILYELLGSALKPPYVFQNLKNLDSYQKDYAHGLVSQ